MFVPSHSLLSVAPQTQAPSKPVVILQPHSHRLLLAGSILANVVMGGLIVGFFVYGPKAIGSGIDEILAVLLGLGVAFAWYTRRRNPHSFIFEGKDAVETSNPSTPVP